MAVLPAVSAGVTRLVTVWVGGAGAGAGPVSAVFVVVLAAGSVYVVVVGAGVGAGAGPVSAVLVVVLPDGSVYVVEVVGGGVDPSTEVICKSVAGSEVLVSERPLPVVQVERILLSTGIGMLRPTSTYQGPP